MGAGTRIHAGRRPLRHRLQSRRRRECKLRSIYLKFEFTTPFMNLIYDAYDASIHRHRLQSRCRRERKLRSIFLKFEFEFTTPFMNLIYDTYDASIHHLFYV
jgi:hypothetical protein